MKTILVGILAAMLLLAVGCSGDNPDGRSSGKSEESICPAVVNGKDFCVLKEDGTYAPAFLNGVNIGAAKPGYFPGEFGVTKEDYLRWFGYIADMNVNTIRVYVNQMPAFYEALAEFNARAEKPLYLFHGVYTNEDLIAQYEDAFGGNGAITDSFYQDIRNAVDMIHGNADIEKHPGNAGGTYTADISRWVLGWILGIEWDAVFVGTTNSSNPDKTAFNGTYIRTENASPFEVFLAETAETAIQYETDHYGVQRPLALNNWCTTDPLDHPNEPNAEMEDAVTVDTEHILATEAFSPGLFASYHVYPYYPDFMSYEVRYRETKNPYLAYLKELNVYHSVPVLVAEYGIPAARGTAHENTLTGLSQGHASEKQQAQWLISLNKDIREAGCMGAFIFTWQDEWFKRTWNSMDYEDSDRRPFWYNAQSPEECFGLLAFESGEKKPVVTVDGLADEWKGHDLLLENDGLSLSVRSDAGYLYLLIRSADSDLKSDSFYLPISVLPGYGNDHTRAGTLRFHDGAEFLLHVNGENDTRITVDAAYDVFMYDYSDRLKFFDPLPGQHEKNSGFFNAVYLAMNRPQHLPETNVDNPFERIETGILQHGIADPEKEDYNSLADFCFEENLVEIRIPWMMLGFMDPSSKKVMGNFEAENGIAAVTTDGIRIGILREDSVKAAPMNLYTWENWDMPVTHERLKQSYFILKDYFAE